MHQSRSIFETISFTADYSGLCLETEIPFIRENEISFMRWHQDKRIIGFLPAI